MLEGPSYHPFCSIPSFALWIVGFHLKVELQSVLALWQAETLMTHQMQSTLRMHSVHSVGDMRIVWTPDLPPRRCGAGCPGPTLPLAARGVSAPQRTIIDDVGASITVVSPSETDGPGRNVPAPTTPFRVRSTRPPLEERASDPVYVCKGHFT